LRRAKDVSEDAYAATFSEQFKLANAARVLYSRLQKVDTKDLYSSEDLTEMCEVATNKYLEAHKEDEIFDVREEIELLYAQGLYPLYIGYIGDTIAVVKMLVGQITASIGPLGWVLAGVLAYQVHTLYVPSLGEVHGRQFLFPLQLLWTTDTLEGGRRMKATKGLSRSRPSFAW
jgi:hypothetical protein